MPTQKNEIVWTGSFIWLCALILSFSYDHALFKATQYDKLNPRLFDLMVFAGLILVAPTTRKQETISKPIRLWLYLIGWFAVCTLFTVLVYEGGGYSYESGDFTNSSFSMYYLFKYIEGVICIWIIHRIRLNEAQKRVLIYVIIAGGIYVGVYSIFEYMNAITGARSINVIRDVEIGVNKSGLVGPLSYSYFHLGLQACLSACFAIALSRSVNWYLSFPLFVLVVWPAYVCGSRAYLFSAILLTLVMLVSGRVSKYINAIIITAAIIFTVANVEVVTQSIEDTAEYSSSIGRLIATEEGRGMEGNVLSARASQIFTGWDCYKYGLPLAAVFGTGFYISPAEDAGVYYYRIGYGFHNAYFFPLEQGGIPGFVLSLVFLWTLFAAINRISKSQSKVDSQFAAGCKYLLLYLMLFGYPSVGWWHGVSTTNFSNYFIIIVTLALIPTSSEANVKPWRLRAGGRRPRECLIHQRTGL